MAQNPVITIEMEDGGIIRAELYPDKIGRASCRERVWTWV